MKDIFYCCLLIAGLSVLSACSSKAYDANPNSNVNGSVNPLHPLTASEFTWSGTDPMSASIDGAGWVASNATWTLDSGSNILFGYAGTQFMAISLANVYGGNVYNMGYEQYTRYADWTDSVGSATNYFQSVLGNSGEVYIIENDSARIKGLFYFQGVSTNGNIENISNGYFNISKI